MSDSAFGLSARVNAEWHPPERVPFVRFGEPSGRQPPEKICAIFFPTSFTVPA